MESDLAELVKRLAIQLAAILLAAKLAGELCERYLKVPTVLGELAAGVVIGPYLLGGVGIPGFGPLFAAPSAEAGALIPVSPELWSVGQIGAVVLLFVAGLETDLRQFLRYSLPATAVAIGGVVAPFLLGAYATVLFGFAGSLGSPAALFMGAALTATSVGITARVLGEQRKLATPEGVTILGAAVVDDVLGILVLTVVVGIAATGTIAAGQVAGVTLKAVVFWLGLTGAGILAARYLSRFVLGFRAAGAAVALALALALFASGLAESFGLALIIGAYSIGLALSTTELARRIEGAVGGVYHALVPVFFVVMGMLVNLSSLGDALLFGVVISLLAIAGKVVGCGLPALAVGFSPRGALRVGVGMLPRGEVALIIAGVGLSRGVIEKDLFGVAILMTLVTTVLAPPLLVPLFARGGPGRRGAAPS